MIEKLNKTLSKLRKLLPGCYIKYGPNLRNRNLIDFYIYYDKRKKYIKINIIKEKIDKINLRILAKEIKTMINKQYYSLETGIVMFDEFILNEDHIPRIN